MNTVVSPRPVARAVAAGQPSIAARLVATVRAALERAAAARAQNQLLELARQYEHLQPSFASDLRAAAKIGPLL